MDRQEYLASFSGKARQTEALNKAHDIRKFEIEMYWKRATYFWTIIGVALAGFFVLARDPASSDTYVVSCLGFLFSLGWYLVNRGSSVWQRNWEAHVDLLEDEITGPLHKTVINRRIYRFWDLPGPFAFSPSRINSILSLLVLSTWLFLAIRTAWRVLLLGSGGTTILIVTLLTVCAAAAALFWGRPKPTQQPLTVDVRVRKYL